MRSYILPGEGYTWSDRVSSLSYRKQETSKEEDAEWTQMSGDQAWVWRRITLQTKANASRKTQQPAVLNANERLNKTKRHKRLLDLASWKSIVTLTRVKEPEGSLFGGKNDRWGSWDSAIDHQGEWKQNGDWENRRPKRCFLTWKNLGLCWWQCPSF